MRPDFIEMIRLESRGLANNGKLNPKHEIDSTPRGDLFNIKSADEWLTEEAAIAQKRQLMGSLWYENELCILFADTNLGKSILAVQIGYGLAKQDPMAPFGSQLNEALKVVYIDLELSSSQFKLRYSDRMHGHHHFGDNFLRAEFNVLESHAALHANFNDKMSNEIESMIRRVSPKVLIIDNITCLGTSTHAANSALALMKNLRSLKSKYGLSMLVLAHTPKRNRSQPLTANDLQGSKMLINFCDSAFTIGESQAKPGVLYIKQIKQRNTAPDYGENNVCLFSIKKQISFLGFEFLGYDIEQAHLRKGVSMVTDDLIQKIVALKNQALSSRQIADHLRISSSTVLRVLKTMESE